MFLTIFDIYQNYTISQPWPWKLCRYRRRKYPPMTKLPDLTVPRYQVPVWCLTILLRCQSEVSVSGSVSDPDPPGEIVLHQIYCLFTFFGIFTFFQMIKYTNSLSINYQPDLPNFCWEKKSPQFFFILILNKCLCFYLDPDPNYKQILIHKNVPVPIRIQNTSILIR